MTLKEDIRQKIITERQKLSQKIIDEKALLAFKKIIPLFETYKPKILAAYNPIQNEFNISFIIEYEQKQNIKILYPRVNKKNAPLTFHETSVFETGAFSIEQPPIDAPQYVPDMIICPFIAIDKDKKRLGFGGGFYDRTIANLPHAITIAIGYDFQIIEDFGAEDHDMVFDYVISV